LPDTQQLVWLFFRFSGRVSRAAYFLAGLFLAIIQAFLLYRFTLVPQDSPSGQAWASLFWVVVLVSIWSNVALGVKRLHDIDRPGAFAVALFIPVISIVAFLALCLVPGNPGPNRYGRLPNSPA
jgi:uncharacterized membrane protein YhaH (DUF805 family)